jgi:glutaredoxin 3
MPGLKLQAALFMAEIVIYRTRHCGYCFRAHALLEGKGVPFKEIDVSDDPGKRRWLVDVTKQRTVPQVFIDGKPVGGFDELARLNRSGELDRLLAVSV